MDSAFPSGAYPAYTTAQLRDFVAAGRGTDLMFRELDRRAAVAAGDRAQMTAGERLRRARQAR